MDADAPVIVLTTFPADGDAEAFADRLVTEHLAACVNVIAAVRSVYRWRGAVERADERQLIIKTTAGHVADLERRLGEWHPYDVPEFLVVPVDGGSAAYLSWLRDSAR